MSRYRTYTQQITDNPVVLARYDDDLNEYCGKHRYEVVSCSYFSRVVGGGLNDIETLHFRAFILEKING